MQYYVNFQNDTDQVWTMAVYQTLPDAVGLDSVAWKRTTAPHGGNSGVEWSVNYTVNLADYKQIGGIGVYKSSQMLDTQLGSAWKIVFDQGVQQLVPDPNGNVPAGYIGIANKSGEYANPGIGMDGAGSVFKNQVANGANAQFKVTPTYWVGLFNQLILGEVVSSNVTVGPLELKFTDSHNTANVHAYLQGSSIMLDVKYAQSLLVTADQLQAQLSASEMRRFFALPGMPETPLLGASATGIAPDEGKANSQTIILGNGFGYQAQNVQVTFIKDKQRTGAYVDSVRDTQIAIHVPQLASDKYQVEVKVNGIVASGNLKFTVV